MHAYWLSGTPKCANDVLDPISYAAVEIKKGCEGLDPGCFLCTAQSAFGYCLSLSLRFVSVTMTDCFRAKKLRIN